MTDSKAAWEPPSLPVNVLFYRGNSMAPTFRPGDLVRFVPARECRLRVGDVIIYPDPDADGDRRSLIIHRIVAMEGGRIRTRGDHNSAPDPYHVAQGDVLGQAISRTPVCGGAEHTVTGGWAGLMRARVLWLRSAAIRTVRGLLHRPYHWLAVHLAPRMPAAIQSRIYCFRVGGADSRCLTLFGRPVGRLLPGGQWSIRPPFRLFIDPSRLPSGQRGDRNPQQMEDSNHV